MKYRNFSIRLLSLAVVAAALFQYNSVALSRQQLVQENENKIAEAEAYNESVMALESTENDAGSSENTVHYADGAWEGSGIGFGGEIRVSVTVADGSIESVEILSADDEDPAYFNMAKVLTESIVEEQSTDIDTISGATFSSHGILDAAADALSKAVTQ